MLLKLSLFWWSSTNNKSKAVQITWPNPAPKYWYDNKSVAPSQSHWQDQSNRKYSGNKLSNNISHNDLSETTCQQIHKWEGMIIMTDQNLKKKP